MSEITHGQVARLADVQNAANIERQFFNGSQRALEQAPEAWAWENSWLAESLRLHVSDLAFLDTVDEMRGQLARLPDSRPMQIESRIFGWVPDDTTRNYTNHPRLRALWMNVAELSWPTPNRGWSGESIQSKASFYLGGLALETPIGIDFHYFTSSYPNHNRQYEQEGYGRQIYGLTAGSTYDMLAQAKQELTAENSLGQITLAFSVLRLLGSGSENFESAQKLDEANRVEYVSAAARLYTLMPLIALVEEELARKPVCGSRERLRIGESPTLRLQKLIGAIPTEESPDVLTGHLRPLVNWNRLVDRGQIAGEFDAFVVQLLNVQS